MFRIDARPDTHADNKLAAIDRQRLLKGLNNTHPGRLDVFAALSTGENDGEFVATQPRSKTERLDCRLQTFRKTHQDTIAKGVPHAIVDVLEIVNIKKVHPYLRSCRARALNCGVKENEPFSAVWKASQRIVLCQLLKLQRALCYFQFETLLIVARRSSG